MIDPPLGYSYGFPKAAPVGVDPDAFLADLAAWLVDNGYPQAMIDLHGGVDGCRIIGDFESFGSDTKIEVPIDPAA